MPMQKTISSISVITSAVCNLNCSFCYLHKNKSYHEFNKLVLKAWEDGSYITNIVKTIKGLDGNPKDVSSIQIWGGETLLSIKTITPKVKDLYFYFPNLNDWKMSTNFLVNINDLFNFLIEIENNAKKNTRILL